MIGFSPFIGEVAREAQSALWFFLLAFAITAAAALAYTRSLLLASLAVGCSLFSLIWQFGVMGAAGLNLNPLALIIPFLAYAIGVSHGVQQINLISAGVAKGLSGYDAARASFRRLLWPGGSALITAIAGFLEEIDRIRREPVSEQELTDVQAYLTGSYVFAFERNTQLARYAVRSKRFGLGFDHIERYPELIRGVTREDVLRVARDHLHPERMIRVSAGAG